ncbi:hypothetical protein KGO95_02310 [Patescibacteria group bacterium]|nr:hypothetical protein [Patescibacteria group bacterium]
MNIFRPRSGQVLRRVYVEEQPKRSGQVMLITVLALSGTLLGATAIAGYLMLNQVRQTTDTVNSTKAVFAADAGIEWRLYKFFKVDGEVCQDCPAGGACPAPALTNNATFTTTCTSSTASTTQTVDIQSKGLSNNSARAFDLTFSRQVPATTTPP